MSDAPYTTTTVEVGILSVTTTPNGVWLERLGDSPQAIFIPQSSLQEIAKILELASLPDENDERIVLSEN